MGRLRGDVGPGDIGGVARSRRGRRRRPLLPQHRQPRPGARALQGDPVGRGARQSPPADRRRPGGRTRGAVEEPPVHPVPPRPRLLPLLLPERVRGRSRRRGDRRRTAGGGDRRELRPGPRRGQQPAQPGDRGSRLLGGSARRGRARDRVREGDALPGDPPGRETFPGPRGHIRRLPRGVAARPCRKGDAPAPRTAPLPPRRARRDPGAHDRPRGVPGARPRLSRDLVTGGSPRPAAGAAAVPGDRHLRRARDEGDRGSVRHRGGFGPRRVRRVRRGARLPGGNRPGGGDRPSRPRDPGPGYFPAGGGGGGGPVGAASGVGGGERTLSAGASFGRGGEASAAGDAPAGGLGKYRANIAGR